jgi:hypothetical protein
MTEWLQLYIIKNIKLCNKYNYEANITKFITKLRFLRILHIKDKCFVCVCVCVCVWDMLKSFLDSLSMVMIQQSTVSNNKSIQNNHKQINGTNIQTCWDLSWTVFFSSWIVMQSARNSNNIKIFIKQTARNSTDINNVRFLRQNTA